MMVSNRNLLFQGAPIFRFHVCFGGCRASKKLWAIFVVFFPLRFVVSRATWPVSQDLTSSVLLRKLWKGGLEAFFWVVPRQGGGGGSWEAGFCVVVFFLVGFHAIFCENG